MAAQNRRPFFIPGAAAGGGTGRRHSASRRDRCRRRLLQYRTRHRHQRAAQAIATRDAAARYLAELWTRTNALSLPIVTAAAGSVRSDAGTIAFRRASGFGAEAYELKVAPQRITVTAGTAAGLFYGAVTLWQLLPPGAHDGRIPAQTIRDAPALSHGAA